MTHTLAGATLARSGLGRVTPLATTALVLGANLPDIDGVVYLFDGTLSLALRRGWTHGVLAMLVLPLALTGVLLAVDRLTGRRRRPAPGPLLAISALAVWSHPLLDWLNVYGVRLLAPFSDHWFYGDTLFIIDPWLLLVLFVGWVAARRGRGRRARVALAIAGLYVAAMWGISRSARAAVEGSVTASSPAAGVESVPGDKPAAGAETRDRSSERWSAARRFVPAPPPLDPLARTVIVETENGYHFVDVPRPGAQPRLAGAFVPRNPELVAAASERSREARLFLRWSRLPYAQLAPDLARDTARRDATGPSPVAARGIRLGDARYAGQGFASVTVAPE